MSCKHEYFQHDKKIWMCWKCNLKTRHYDGTDRTMMRPIHEYMSVALKGVNTIA